MLSEKLTNKFKMSQYSNVLEWKNATRCDLSTETVSKVIIRGHEPSIPTFITMAYHLNFTPAEISAACKEAGDTIFYKLIAPLDLDTDDKRIIKLIHDLSPEKKKLILEVIKQMAV